MKKEFHKRSLKFNADFKSTCCINIISNLYSLLCSLTIEKDPIGPAESYTDRNSFRLLKSLKYVLCIDQLNYVYIVYKPATYCH